MNKKQIKQATFKDLLAKRTQKKAKKEEYKDILVSSMGSTLKFKKPGDDLVLDIMDKIGNENKVSLMVPAFKELIYLTCDMLQDPKLHEECGIKDNFDIVDEIFDLADVLEIGEQLMDMLDLNKKSDDIKN